TRIVFSGPFEYSRRNSYILGALGEALEVRLRDALREDLGATYGVSVSTATAREPWPSFRVSTAFGAAPDRIDDLARAVFDEIGRIASVGPDSTTVANIKEQHRRAYETNLRLNGYWLSQIITAIQIGDDFGIVDEFPRLVNALSAADIQRAARLLSADRFVRVTLMPESG